MIQCQLNFSYMYFYRASHSFVVICVLLIICMYVRFSVYITIGVVIFS